MGFGVATRNGRIENGEMSVEVQVAIRDTKKSASGILGYAWRTVGGDLELFNYIANEVSTCALPNL